MLCDNKQYKVLLKILVMFCVAKENEGLTPSFITFAK